MTAMPTSPSKAGQASGSDKELVLDLPMLTIRVRPPEMRMPRLQVPGLRMPRMSMPSVPRPSMPRVSRQEVGQVVDVAKTMLPPPERMVYYGALGALAMIGVLEWPVAAAIGAGTVIAQRARAGESAGFWTRGDRAARALPPRPASTRKATTTTSTRDSATGTDTTVRTETTPKAAGTQRATTAQKSTTAEKNATAEKRAKGGAAQKGAKGRTSAAGRKQAATSA